VLFHLFILATTAASLNQYRALHDLILEEITAKPALLPKFARASFHDLANYDGGPNGGPNGCIGTRTKKQHQNRQLLTAMDRLAEIVGGNFPIGTFPFSDVVSMAGKVSMEKAFRIRIRWRGGRKDCTTDEEETGPRGNLSTIGDLNPFLERYGFTAREMAVLLAGTHGLKDAVIQTKSGNSPMATKNSGLDWISESEEGVWIYYDSQGKDFEPFFEGSNGVGRLPVDMIFFPTILREKSNSAFGSSKFVIDESKEASEIEAYLGKFYGDDYGFRREFARVFSKMLEIGTKDLGEWYRDEPLPM